MAYSSQCSKLAEHLNSLCTEQLRRKYVLPENFKQNFLKCLPAGIDALRPCLLLLSKVTFKSDEHDPAEVFALWRRISEEFEGSPFVKANFLKAATKVCTNPKVPGVLRSSVEFEACYAVLIASIHRNELLGAEFFTRLDSVNNDLTELETIDLAEKLLTYNYPAWPRLTTIFSKLLGVMLVLNYDDTVFMSQVRSLCEENENFKEIVDACRSTWFQIN